MVLLEFQKYDFIHSCLWLFPTKTKTAKTTVVYFLWNKKKNILFCCSVPPTTIKCRQSKSHQLHKLRPFELFWWNFAKAFKNLIYFRFFPSLESRFWWFLMIYCIAVNFFLNQFCWIQCCQLIILECQGNIGVRWSVL